MKSRDQQGRPGEAVAGALRDGAGADEVFQRLFDRFYRPLFRFFEGRGFSTEERQDLIQETFLRVHRGLPDFRGDTGWEPWIFRIAANTAAKALRRGAAGKRAGRTVPLEEEEEGEASMSAGPHGEASAPLRRLLDKERTEILTQAIAGLPAQMRRCVRLRVFQDLDYEEIAEVMQISPSTVKVQMFKARKRLQGQLEDFMGDFDL